MLGGGAGAGAGAGEQQQQQQQTNILNLKLFHPPKRPAIPVPEHAIPVLLRRDRHMYMYDWDLAINWVSLHIDGITTARQISKKAEVDMEMVLEKLCDDEEGNEVIVWKWKPVTGSPAADNE